MTYKTVGRYETQINLETALQLDDLYSNLLNSGQIGPAPQDDEKTYVDENIEYTRYWNTEAEADIWIQTIQTTMPDLAVTISKIQVD